jgi:hypothetical protein
MAQNSFGHLYGQPSAQPPTRGVVLPAPPPAPTAPYEAPKAAADVQKAQADAIKAQIEAQQTQQEIGREQTIERRRALNQTYKTENVLRAIRAARRVAQDQGGSGWEILLSGVPSTDARRLRGELDTISANLSFDRLQQMRDESTTGGALGSITERELQLLGSVVASIDQGVDLPTFLERLDQIERSFLRAQIAAQGINPDAPEGVRAIKQDYGYTGVLEGELTPEAQALAAPNATQTAVDIPPEYQAAHLRYLRDNWGNVDPRAYASFRARLDEQFGLTPDLGAYAAAVPGFNAAAQQGVAPEQLGAVPAPPRDLGMIEQGINRAARSDLGAFTANLGNATFAGLPVALSGDQAKLELLREAQPVGSFLGEVGGNIAGTLLTGGVAGRAGLNLLARPLGAELAYGTTYGATQDENAGRGALTGGAGALAGGLIGRQIGKAFPDTINPAAMRRLDEGVPTIEDLKTLAGRQYGAVEATGVTASPGDTAQLAQRMTQVLEGESRVTPAGNLIDENTPITKAIKLLNDFAGQPMTPGQARSVRQVLSEGRGVGTPNERRIAGVLVDEFDNWAAPALPGVDVPRQTAQRYLQGQQIAERVNIGNIRGMRAKGNDVGDSLRTQFGQLDEAIERGDAYFEPATREAIGLAARGDTLTNTLRNVGKYGFGSVLPTTGIAGAGVSTAFAQTDPLLMAIPATIGGIGTAARRLAEQRTARQAQDALASALVGPEYARMRQLAAEEAAMRGGQIFGGATGGMTGMFNRRERQLPR